MPLKETYLLKTALCKLQVFPNLQKKKRDNRNPKQNYIKVPVCLNRIHGN